MASLPEPGRHRCHMDRFDYAASVLQLKRSGHALPYRCRSQWRIRTRSESLDNNWHGNSLVQDRYENSCDLFHSAHSYNGGSAWALCSGTLD